MAKLIEHWHLRPKGARLMWMRRVRRLCLRPWYWRMTLLFWFQKIPKTKVSHVTLRVLGGRRVRLWRSAETGEGAPSVRRNNYLLPFSWRISPVLENCRSEFPNFLHAASYWNSKDTLLPRFAKILLCVDL